MASGLGPVDLGEGLEYAPLVLGGDADPGVGDLHAHDVAPPRWPADSEGHSAVVGELDCVRDEVDQDLANAAGVAPDHRGHVSVALGDELKALGGGGVCQQTDDVVDQPPQLELADLELDLAGFDLGEVEDVVDESEEAGARPLHPLGEPALGVVEGGVEEHLVHAEDTVGVLRPLRTPGDLHPVCQHRTDCCTDLATARLKRQIGRTQPRPPRRSGLYGAPVAYLTLGFQ